MQAAGNPMRIQLTGQVRVVSDASELGESELPGRQGRLVLAVLALAGEPVHRDVLADALWPDGLPATWERTLSGVISRLRSAFVRAGFDGLTIANAFGCYELQVPMGAEIDVRTAAGHVTEAERLLGVGDLASAREAAVAALDVARRPLLAGDDAPWLERERDELKGVLLRALDAAAGASLGSSDAVTAATEAVDVDPFRESSHALLMRAHATLGNTADALLAYERCRELLANELGIDPSPETQAIHLALLQDDEDAVLQRLSTEGLVTLPSTSTSFIGRDGALRELIDRIGRERLVTLLGPGGVGKTRLAVEVARNVVESFPDGVHLIDLTTVGTATALAELVTQTLGLNLRGDVTAEALAGIVRTHRLLLVMDNCEHVLADAAAYVRELIDHTDNVVVLATSREPLGVSSESTFEVPALDVPVADADTTAMSGTESVALFGERAAKIRPDFVVGPANVAVIAEICRELEGMPLAIELAAARVGAMSVTEVRERLADRLALQGDEGFAQRHRTLHAVIDWSYDLLGSHEAEAFRRLAVFEGSFAPAAAVAVHDGSIDLVASLTARSLLTVDADGRYRMLETIKHYARSRADGSGDWEPAVGRHIDHVRQIASELRTARDYAAQLRGVGAIRADGIAALERALERGRIDDAIALVESQWNFWLAQGMYAQARGLCERTIAAARASGVGSKLATVLFGLATIRFNHAEFAEAEAMFAEAETLAVDEGDAWARAEILASHASVFFATGRLEEAQSRAEAAVAAADASGHDVAAGLAHMQFIGSSYARGDIATASTHAEHALERFTRANHQTGVARALMAVVGVADGAREDWRDLLERAVDLSREADDAVTLGIALISLGLALAEAGSLEDSMERFVEALRLTRRIGDRRAFLNAAEQMALVAAETGSPNAFELIAAVDAQRSALAIVPSYLDNTGRLARLTDRARASAGRDVDAITKQASALSEDEIFALGLDIASSAFVERV
jgi:predicted ATPase/DNA-binding SARP family transcriptional activator